MSYRHDFDDRFANVAAPEHFNPNPLLILFINLLLYMSMNAKSRNCRPKALISSRKKTHGLRPCALIVLNTLHHLVISGGVNE